MARMGKKPVAVVDKVEVKIAGSEITVKGPKGTLEFTLPDGIAVEQQDNALVVSIAGGLARDLDAKQGLCRALLQNMITGVSAGFKRELEFQGVGYRGQLKGRRLTLNLGFSNPKEYDVPEDVDVSMPDATHIVLESIDKQSVGQVAATIRGFRPPDAYKGKGIRYVGEQITLKEGKTVA